MPEERAYWRCDAITTKGERCRAYALPHGRFCVVHLPADHPLRIAHFADQARRIRAYHARLRLAKEIAAAATAAKAA